MNSTADRAPGRGAPPRHAVVQSLVRWFPRAIATFYSRLFLSPRRRQGARQSGRGEALAPVRVGRHWVRVYAEGEGPVVLLVHGWAGSSAQLVEIGRALVAAGFRVISFDMPAHGETSGSVTSLPEFIQGINAVAARFESVHAVVGHSLGATAAVLAEQGALAVQGLVLIAPMPSFDFALAEFARIVRLPEPVLERTARLIERRVGMLRPEGDLGRVEPTALTLLIHDEKDGAIPVEKSRQLSASWSRARYLETHGLGHNRILADDGVIGGVRDFIRGLPLRAPTDLEQALVSSSPRTEG
jgi:pimeloyl-ACP methyl ester carboxylesterase